jgi:predicted GIY-YIG superfamily endonuclease
MAGRAGRGREAAMGTVYLLHFDRPYRHARHYCGWTTDLEERLREHRAGHGARLMEVITTAGIAWTIAGTWPGTRREERRRKRWGSAVKWCPVCREERKNACR